MIDEFSVYRKQGKIRWAKLLRFSWFSEILQTFFCEYKCLSLIILNNEYSLLMAKATRKYFRENFNGDETANIQPSKSFLVQLRQFQHHNNRNSSHKLRMQGQFVTLFTIVTLLISKCLITCSSQHHKYLVRMDFGKLTKLSHWPIPCDYTVPAKQLHSCTLYYAFKVPILVIANWSAFLEQILLIVQSRLRTIDTMKGIKQEVWA